MAVSIDTVYQRVLVLANKEQRGYITPQEFNLLANHAQMEIFEQYFYDVNQASGKHRNNTIFGDPLELLMPKLEIFHSSKVLNGVNVFELPDDLYRLMEVRYQGATVEKLTHSNYQNAMVSPLTAPTLSRPIYHLKDKRIVTGPDVDFGSINVMYYLTPPIVQWAYVIVNDKPLHNANISVDFMLHAAEETELVYKILKLAGVNLKAQEVVQVGQALEQTQIQQEKQ